MAHAGNCVHGSSYVRLLVHGVMLVNKLDMKFVQPLLSLQALAF